METVIEKDVLKYVVKDNMIYYVTIIKCKDQKCIIIKKEAWSGRKIKNSGCR